MESFSKMWNTSYINQVFFQAIPLKKDDDIRDHLRTTRYKKPDAYKSINSSQMQINASKNLMEI